MSVVFPTKCTSSMQQLPMGEESVSSVRAEFWLYGYSSNSLLTGTMDPGLVLSFDSVTITTICCCNSPAALPNLVNLAVRNLQRENGESCPIS